MNPKISDLVINILHPQAGIGLVIEVGSQEDYIIAMFPVHGLTVVYADEVLQADEWEVVSASR